MRLFKARPKPSRPHRNIELYVVDDQRPVNRYSQPYKGIWLVFSEAPTPETIRWARESFDRKYPDCEQCGKTVYLCTCMAEIDNAWSDANGQKGTQS